MKRTKKITSTYIFFIGLFVGVLAMVTLDLLFKKETEKEKKDQIQQSPSTQNDPKLKQISSLKTVQSPSLPARTTAEHNEKNIHSDNVQTQSDDLQTEVWDPEEIVDTEMAIAQDKLLGTKKIKIPIYENGDSVSTVEFLVEFWSSPINYKGYKRNDTHLLFFGIDMDSEFKLVFINDLLWLERKNQRFILKKSYEFQRFSSQRNRSAKNLAVILN
ncbi:MAG: hypothetical protein RR190_04805 [Bacteroidales bacterium]